MSNLNLNKVILAGRLTQDPELKQTQTGNSVLSFTLAVTRRYANKSQDPNAQPQTDFLNCVAWRATAEFISRYFRKGSALCIVGSLQTRTWLDNQNQKRYVTEIIVDEAMFVDSRNESPASNRQDSYTPQGGAYMPDSYSAPSYSSSPDNAPKFEEVKTDDDLPF